jgi:hypothetical protein
MSAVTEYWTEVTFLAMWWQTRIAAPTVVRAVVGSLILEIYESVMTILAAAIPRSSIHWLEGRLKEAGRQPSHALSAQQRHCHTARHIPRSDCQVICHL